VVGGQHDDPDVALEKVVGAMLDLTRRQQEKAGKHKGLEELLEEADSAKDRNGTCRKATVSWAAAVDLPSAALA
jgi:hypothetical protein